MPIRALSRRGFLQGTAAIAGAASLSALPFGARAQALDALTVGFIYVGRRTISATTSPMPKVRRRSSRSRASPWSRKRMWPKPSTCRSRWNR